MLISHGIITNALYPASLITAAALAWRISKNSFNRSEKARKKTEAKAPKRLSFHDELIFKSAGEGVLGTDAGGRVTMVNPAATSMIEWTAEELIGQPIHTVLFCSKAGNASKERGDRPLSEVLDEGRTKNRTTDLFWRKDGTSFPVEYTATPIRENGKAAGAVVVFRDISDRKQAEEALRAAVIKAKEERARTEAIIAAIGDGISIQDRRLKIMYQNQALKELAGDRSGEYCYKAYFNREEQCGVCHLAELFKDGKVRTLERQWESSGGMRYIELTSSPLRGADGSIIGGIELSKDITDRKQAEMELKTAMLKARQEQATTRAFIAALGDLLSIYDRNYKFIFQNDLHKKLYGERTGEYCYSVYFHRDSICDDCHIAEMFRDGNIRRIERTRMTDEGAAYYDITASPLRDDSGAIIGGIELVRDVTDQKLAEQALKSALIRANEERARSEAIVAAIGDQMVILDPGFKIVYENKIARDTIGDHAGKVCYQAFENRDLLCDGCPVALSFQDGRVHRGERVAASIIGTMHLDITASPLLDASGTVIAVVEMVRDITARKQEEESLLLFKNLLDRSNDALFVNDPVTGRFLFVNEKACSNLGYDSQKLLSLRTTDIETMFPDQRAWDAHVAEVKRRGSLIVEETHQREDGSLVPVEVNVTYMTIGASDYLVAMARDISERKLAEQTLRASEERLRKSHDELEILVEERTAELTMVNQQLRNLSVYLQKAREDERTMIAREVHDDLGQSLTALKIDLSLLRKKLRKDQKAADVKAESMNALIEETIRNVRRIATELRPGMLDHIGLTAAIDWQAREFETRTGTRCAVSFQPPELVVDKDRATTIFRVFQETLTNVARHANAAKVSVLLAAKEGTLLLKITDNGKGITEKQMSDPKSLGLIGIRERVYSWGGRLTIHGSRGKGTTLTVQLPLDAPMNVHEV